MNQSKIHVTAFYLFFSWPENTDFLLLSKHIESWCEERKILGLLLIGTEGFNGTMASESFEALEEFKLYLRQLGDINHNIQIEFKDSLSHFMPFRRTKVKVKTEIVTLGNPKVVPPTLKDSSHLSPKEWNEFIKTKNPIVLDVRNDYEMNLGKFKTALDWKMKEFTEFPELVKNLTANENYDSEPTDAVNLNTQSSKHKALDTKINKNQPILMYCTGGIRCEKASIEMKNQGFSEVYQLDGGILNYIKEYPNDEFQGECFVFDHRVAVDQNLMPTQKYVLCPHCGQPAEVSPFDCVQCGTQTNVCENCLDSEVHDLSIRTCSKNCRHHYQLGHKSKRPHLDSRKKYKDSINESKTTS